MSAAPIAPQLVFAPNPSTTRATATPLSSHGTRLVYTSGRSVVLRDLAAPTATLLYAQHAHAVSVARISPSGYYCASGDVAGNIRVWDIAGSDMVLKLEKKAPGPVRDLAWDAESKRIAAVGDGKESFGTFFLADSGSSCGEVTGHSKVLNAVAIKPQRPFKAVTAGDDCSVVFYNGVPFKYGASTSAHTRFIQTLAYAPNGTVFASGGSDGKIQLYDGTTGASTAALQAGGTAGQQAHAGTVFAVAFSQDSAQLLSAGADAALRLWDVGAQKVAHTFDLKNMSGGGANDQLVGACFVGKDRVVALALSGALHVIEIANGNATVLHGPTKAVGPSALALVDGTFLLGSYDGKVLSTSLDGACKLVQDAGAAITGMAQAGRSSAWVIGMDDTVRRFASGAFDSTSVSTSGQARSVAGSDAVALVATSQGLDVVSGSSKTSHAVGIDATAVALSPDGITAAVGAENGKVLLGSISGGKWQPSMTFENGRRAVSALAFSPDGALLAAGETGGRIMVYDVKAGNLKLNQWVNHTGRINALAFSPDGSRAVSAGGDTNVYVWSVARPMKNVALRNAHAGGATGALWLDDTTIATAGADAALKTFKVPALP